MAERSRLEAAGAESMTDPEFLSWVRHAVRETTIWLVNSASDVRKVDWNVAPVHILVGGNKLDRGFTVEGLTVTYMNRPASPQIDTLEQRARAFGYRRDLLPYCQFFAGPRTLSNLRDVVFTEYDLRAELQDWIEGGGSVAGWANHVGLLLPPGTKPTRDAVIMAVSRFNHLGEGWHSMRRPSLDLAAVASNRDALQRFGIFEAPYVDYGRLQHRTIGGAHVSELVRRILQPWERSRLQSRLAP